MAAIPNQERREMESIATGAYLQRLNQYALTEKLITSDIYRSIEASIRKEYGINHQER